MDINSNKNDVLPTTMRLWVLGDFVSVALKKVR